MHIIKTGKDRIVIVFPRLGFVLKVARLNNLKSNRLFKDVTDAYFCIKTTSIKERLLNVSGILEHFYARGIYANLREKRGWKKTKNPFLMPTFFSFFGFVNIMPYAKRVITWTEFDDLDILMQISYYSGFIWQVSPHTFTKADNFCIDEFDKVKMIDYGFRDSDKFIIRCGQTLYESLNPIETNASGAFQKFKIEIGELRMRQIIQLKAWVHCNCDKR
jgi:hypothetical protein